MMGAPREVTGPTHAHEAGGAERRKLYCNSVRLWLFALLYIMHVTTSAVCGSSSPVAAFAPPSSVLLQQRSSSLRRAARFNDRDAFHLSSTRESVMTQRTSGGYGRSTVQTMPKIKSPSNSFTQFYKEGVLVGIERTSPNSRRISGEIIIDLPIDAIWNILTDYNNLSTHVPNLMESKVINNGGRIVGSRPRVYQRGAQRIFGFEFGADVVMDMTENVHHFEDSESRTYSIDFECVDSQFFSEFDGSWILEQYSNSKTMVRYIVDVRPKGPVPVAALEWRIKEDVPVNILSVSKSASRAASIQKRDMERTRIRASREVELTSETQQEPSRLQQAPPQPSSNPLRRLTSQATDNLKRTAKSVLPSPVISTAKQAIRAINGPNSQTATNPAPSMSVNRSNSGEVGIAANGNAKAPRRKKSILSSKTSIADFPWYEDETMAMYLKDT